MGCTINALAKFSGTVNKALVRCNDVVVVAVAAVDESDWSAFVSDVATFLSLSIEVE